MGEEWRARDQDLDAISAARNSDPFAVLGPHRTAAGWVVRVFAPEAISVRALTRDGALMAEVPRGLQVTENSGGKATIRTPAQCRS